MGTLRDSRGNSVRDSNDREIRTGSSDRDSSSRDSSSRDSSDRGSLSAGDRSNVVHKENIFEHAERLEREANSKNSFSAEDRSAPKQTIESITKEMDAKLEREMDRLLNRNTESTIERLIREDKESYSKDSFGAEDRSALKQTIESITKEMDAQLEKEMDRALVYNRETTIEGLEKQGQSTEQSLVQQPSTERPLIEQLTNIMQVRGKEYGFEKVEDIGKEMLIKGAFFVAKTTTAPFPTLNMVVSGIKEVYNKYDKIDKAEEIKFLNSVVQDIKQIDINQHNPEETGYEFVKFVQYEASEEEMKAFNEQLNMYADMVQEGY